MDKERRGIRGRWRDRREEEREREKERESRWLEEHDRE